MTRKHYHCLNIYRNHVHLIPALTLFPHIEPSINILLKDQVKTTVMLPQSGNQTMLHTHDYTAVDPMPLCCFMPTEYVPINSEIK